MPGPPTPKQATTICIGPRSWLNALEPLQGYSPFVAFDTHGDGNIDGQGRFDPNSDKPISPTSTALTHANRAKLGRMSWREVY